MSGKNITRRLGDLPRGHQCRTSAFILDASVVNHSCDSANGYWRKNPATLARPVPIAEIDPGLPREDEEGDAVPSHLKRLSTGQIGRAVAAGLLAAGRKSLLSAAASVRRAFDGLRRVQPILRSPHHGLAADTADIDLDIEPQNRRPSVMPGKAWCGGTPPHEFVRQRRVNVEDGVELGGGDVGPRAAERRHAPLHGAEHEARLFP